MDALAFSYNEAFRDITIEMFHLLRFDDWPDHRTWSLCNVSHECPTHLIASVHMLRSYSRFESG